MKVAVIDLSVGNLFSVVQACRVAGLEPHVTTDPDELKSARGVVLPGVGAFGDARRRLETASLIEPLVELGSTGRPILGVCLGMQLLMTESEEFGPNHGLGLIPGRVVRLPATEVSNRRHKVPQIGWNRLWQRRPDGSPTLWSGTPLASLSDGAWMYFTHSFMVVPDSGEVVTASTIYGSVTYVSAVHHGSVFGIQAHPERSAEEGLDIYRGFAQMVASKEGL